MFERLRKTFQSKSMKSLKRSAVFLGERNGKAKQASRAVAEDSKGDG